MNTSRIWTMLGRTIRALLEVRQETEVHFAVGTVILWFLPNFKRSQASSPFEALNSVCLSSRQSDVRPLSRWDGDLQLSLGSPQGIQICLNLLRWKTSLNLIPCRDIRTSFQSGPLRVHSNLDRKNSVPLTYLLLRENSSWGTSGKVAHCFSQRQGISSHLETIWGAWIFPWVAVLKLIFIQTWDGYRSECL